MLVPDNYYQDGSTKEKFPSWGVTWKGGVESHEAQMFIACNIFCI
jgi:hypothetical protein